MNLKKSIVFGLLALLTIHVKAQSNDYVITTSNDTLNCKISISFFTKNYSYKLSQEGKSIKIKPTEIKEYYLSNKKDLFMAFYLEKKDKPEYFKVLEKGKILLVEQVTSQTFAGPMGTAPTTYTNQEWFITKGTDTVKELKHNSIKFTGESRNSRKSNFEEMIADNATVLDKYKTEDKFSFKQLRNLVHLYNTGEPLKKE